MLHLLQTSQKNHSAEPKFCMTKPRKMSCSRTCNTRGFTAKKRKPYIQKKKVTASYFSQKPTTKFQKYCSVISVGLDPIQSRKSYRTLIKMYENSTQTKLKSYTQTARESKILKNLLKTIIKKLNGRLTIILSFHKMTFSPLRGKQNLVDIYFTFLSYILSPTQLILMKVTHRDRIQLSSRAPIFMIQTMVKIGKFAPFLTHL